MNVCDRQPHVATENVAQALAAIERANSRRDKRLAAANVSLIDQIKDIRRDVSLLRQWNLQLRNGEASRLTNDLHHIDCKLSDLIFAVCGR